MTWLDEIKKRRAAATPGEWETRCREFSNKAPLEIWTRLGYLDQLPRIYREPSYEFLAHAPTDIDRLVKALEIVTTGLSKIEKHGCCVMHNDSGCPGCIASDVIKEIEGMGEK